MKLGEKIRQARINAGMTQTELAGDFITRNMLSQIENSLAMPSLQTAMYIADRLGIDAGLLLTDGDETGAYFLTRKLPLAKKEYEAGNYDKAIEICLGEKELCDEAYLILAECYLKKAYTMYNMGKLRQALKNAESGVKYGAKSFYSAESIRLKADMLEEMIASVVPLLKQTKNSTEEKVYLTERFVEKTGCRALVNRQREARKLIDGEKYGEALEVLKDCLKEKDIAVPFLYTLYCDIEVCCSEVGDYENAYKYSQIAKKMFSEMQQ